MDKITKRILFAFDFDHTILVENTDTVILKLLSEKAKLDLKPKYESRDNWAHFMQEVYHKMKEEGVTIDQVKQIILEMQFNPGFLDLFSYIKDNKDIFETVIISGSNTVFLNWILNKHNLNELFPIFYTNHAHPDEDCVINIKPYHTHDCEKCDNSQCKRIILDEHISTLVNQNFDHVIFVGDGVNDYCPATVFCNQDFLFARHEFPLTKKLIDKGFIKELKCNVHVWEDGYKIIDEVKKIVENQKI